MKPEINRIKLYLTALQGLGTDVSPQDLADDDVGCADSCSMIILKAFPKSIRHSVSTKELYNQLNTSTEFKKVLDFKPGDIIISPTGMCTGNLAHGHVGIVAENDFIMSNSSANGIWTLNFTIESWVARYRKIGGFPLFSFRKL